MTIEEYETQSEQIADQLLATIDDVDRHQDDIIASQGEFVDAEGHYLEDHPWQYWHWHGAITISADANTTPEQAADRLAAVLEDGGWTAREPDLNEMGGMYEYDRPGDEDGNSWYAEIGFARRDPPAPQNLSIRIASPSTDRTAADS